MSFFGLQKERDVVPEELIPRKVAPQVSAAAATLQTFDFELPTDHFIHQILIEIGEDTNTGVDYKGTLADDLTDISLILNGNRYVKDMTAPMSKQLSIMNKNVMSTGFYALYLTDPKIPAAKPLPAWLFSSIILRLKDNAPAATNYHHIHVTCVQSKRKEIAGNWPLLEEKYLRYKKYGANTGWQDYDHERAYAVLGYLYCMDDNATLSNTIFDKLRVISQGPDGEQRPYEEQWISQLRELDKIEYQSALADGFVAVEFPAGLPTFKYSSLMSQLNIPSAGTNAGLKVLERYVL